MIASDDSITVIRPDGSHVRTIPAPFDPFCGPGTLVRPSYVTVGPGGDLYVASTFCNRVSRHDSTGTLLNSFGFSSGNDVRGLAVDDSGFVYVTVEQFSLGRLVEVRKYTASGSLLAASPVGYAVHPSTVPFGLAHGNGRIYACNRDSVFEFTHDLDYLSALAVTSPYPLQEAIHVAVGDSGRVYVLESYSGGRVFEFEATGAFRTSWNQVTGPPEPGLSSPLAIAAAPGRDIWIADEQGQELLRFGVLGAPSDSASLDGVPNTALGAAQLQLTSSGVLVLSNIGTSGNDGVSFPASASDEGRGIVFAGGLPIDPDLDEGGRIVAEMQGIAGGEAASLGTITIDVVSNGMNITPDFGDLEATDVHVEAFDDDARVHSCRVPNGSVLHRAAPSAAGLQNRVYADSGNGIGGVDVGLKKKPGGTITAVTFTSKQTVTVAGIPVLANKLVFTTASLRQPITAATAVLKIKRPPALATASRPGAALTASNLGQVVIGAQPARPDVGGAPAGGLRAEPKGAAVFAGGGLDDGATVIGIGTSGADGLDIVLDSSTGATHEFGDRMGFDTSTDAGAELEHQVLGKVGCRPDSTVAILKETAFADSIRLAPDFSRIGATGVRITILDRDSVVHEAVYPPARTVSLVEPLAATGYGTRAASINTTRSNIKDKASIAAGGVKVSMKYKRPAGGSGPQLDTDHMPFDFKIGPNRHKGDEARFEAVGGTQVSELTSAKMRQKKNAPGNSKLDSLRLLRGAVDVGGSGAANAAKGQANLTAAQGKLAVHKIGSSGNDGVSVNPERASSAMEVGMSKVGAATELTGTAKMDVKATGKRSGGAAAEQVIAVGVEKSAADKLRIGKREPGGTAQRADGAATAGATYRLEVLSGLAVIATLDGPDPQADFGRMPDRLGAVAAGPAFEGFWDVPLTIDVVGGPSVIGDGIRIRPLGLPDDVEHLTSMDITAADIPAFVIGDWTAPPVTDVPAAPVRIAAPSMRLARNPVTGGSPLELAIALPAAADLDVALFDAQGRRVATLLRGRASAGVTTHRWTPPAGIRSGVYFVRLVAGRARVASKVVLID